MRASSAPAGFRNPSLHPPFGRNYDDEKSYPIGKNQPRMDSPSPGNVHFKDSIKVKGPQILSDQKFQMNHENHPKGLVPSHQSQALEVCNHDPNQKVYYYESKDKIERKHLSRNGTPELNQFLTEDKGIHPSICPLQSHGLGVAKWLNTNKMNWSSKGAGFRNFVPLAKPPRGLNSDPKPLKCRVRKTIPDRIARVYMPRSASAPPKLLNHFEDSFPWMPSGNTFDKDKVRTTITRTTSCSLLLQSQPVEYLPPNVKSAVKYKIHYRDRITNQVVDVNFLDRARKLRAKEMKLKPEFFQGKQKPFDYGYLVGGRYAAAHCIDYNGWKSHGVYVTRNGTVSDNVKKSILQPKWKDDSHKMPSLHNHPNQPFCAPKNGPHQGSMPNPAQQISHGHYFYNDHHEDFHFKYNYVIRDEYYNEYLKKYYQYYGTAVGMLPSTGKGVRVVSSRLEMREDLPGKGNPRFTTCEHHRNLATTDTNSRNARLKPPSSDIKWVSCANTNYNHFRPSKLNSSTRNALNNYKKTPRFTSFFENSN